MSRAGLRLRLDGAVQGAGWRPRIAAAARALELSGWVANSGAGLELACAGPRVEEFLAQLRCWFPASKLCSEAATVDSTGFAIRPSLPGCGAWPALDHAICADCRTELFDPASRRYRDPFISCARCGPRYTLLDRLPYDRAQTAWSGFPLCPRCQHEYADTADRRCHVQGISCPQCGPRLRWQGPAGEAGTEQVIAAAVALLRAGGIVMVQGWGGFHLLVDARNADAIARLRQRKRRPGKPLAVMFASVQQLSAYAEASMAEQAWLSHAAAPVVLLRSRQQLPEAVAGDSPWLGALLAYSPLHLLLGEDFSGPLVATSANRSGEPIIWQRDAEWTGLADGLLSHDRPILRPAEDPVLRIAAGRALWLRLGRGVAPLCLPLSGPPRLALGAQQKNAAALADGRGHAWLNGAGGDLDSIAGERHGRQQALALAELMQAAPQLWLEDAHPDYATRQWPTTTPRRQLWHHPAHLAAVAAECGLREPALGLAWDGTGYGGDGRLLGGEAYWLEQGGCVHRASLLPLRLPGGAAAIRQPWRLAWAMLRQLGIDPASCPALRDQPAQISQMLDQMLRAGVHCPPASSLGRLFDAWSALLGLCSDADHDAAAATALEQAASRGLSENAGWLEVPEVTPWPWQLQVSDGLWQVDWRPAVRAMMDAREIEDIPGLARRFHALWADVAATLVQRSGARHVLLGGGCWQNRLLLEMVVRRLQKDGAAVYWPERFPPNDGGLAYGQLALSAFSPL